MKLHVYQTAGGAFRWRLVDPTLKGTRAFVGSSNQPFKSCKAAVANARLLGDDLTYAKVLNVKPATKKKPVAKKKAAKKK